MLDIEQLYTQFTRSIAEKKKLPPCLNQIKKATKQDCLDQQGGRSPYLSLSVASMGEQKRNLK